MAQMEGKKNCSRAPAHFLIPLRSAIMGDVASAPPGLLNAPLGHVEDEINLYLSIGWEQPQAAIAPKALVFCSKKTFNNHFRCLVVLTGYAILLLKLTRISNTFFCTYESVEAHICNLFMRRVGKTAQSLKISDAKLMR